MLKLSFACVNRLESLEDELELRQVVVLPLRTVFIAAKRCYKNHSALRLAYLVQDRRI